VNGPLDLAIPVWPRKLAPATIGHGTTRPIMVGPQPLAGRPQNVVSDMGAWHVTLTEITIWEDDDKIRLFRALLFGTLAKGLPIYLPFCDWKRNPYARTGVPFSDLSTFSDSSLFAGDVGLVVVAVVAAQRATSLIVLVDASTPVPEAGEFIGLGERTYFVEAGFPDDTIAGRWTLKLWPPLRAAAAIGARVETVDPVCKMQLDPRQVETMLTLENGIVGRPSLDFYESNWT
jgi:hypothetical protein